ncbi:TIGR02444 family protein [Pseudomonas guariconensis]|uniref:TIGR02444 family protein n=1 Tax=Pseudomonas TaxID=286 RepID=UPI001CE41023|nr:MULTISPECIES: TIGR02444 family protein [Pseudomonas]MCO7637186.1 TIGR02444 family protein [Pseudomonas sp. S 311-6]MCO7515318.1 TIGR02444 family protein [Pseudomonas putida]MCO7565721.1 TIGR02444 family protein [Pseudomonas mosselii]MCO7593431.1 TIGR02444 family protein [Pseudomonas guariconensis]MCO7605093.1 TIGR02444 family protein [Pseudomonas guariconensis]
MHTDLWRHALALYGQPGVEAACLELQALGGDVCLLLCGTWLQAGNVQPDAERVHALRSLAEPWQRQVVAPLRVLRQQWRADAQDDAHLAVLREQVKGLELEAERTLLARLQEQARAWPAGPDGPTDDWLAWLAPDQARGHDALHRLRVAAEALQDAVDGD